MTKEEYYHHLWQQSLKRMAACGTVLIAAAILISLLTLGSCRTVKTDDKTEISDSVRTEYIEKIVEVPVVVTVNVPEDKKERLTPDTTSTLSTSFAQSTASLIWRDGLPWLFHSLENIPQKIDEEVKVSVKEKYKIIYRTRYVTRTKTIEKELSWWQQAKLDFSGYIIGILLIFILIFAVYLCIKKKLRRQGISS